MVFLCLLVSGYALSTWVAGPHFLSTIQRSVIDINTYIVIFYVHVTTGSIALLTGWIQFIKKIRLFNPILHKTIGKIYVVSIMVSSIMGFYMAFFAQGGWIARLGFMGLAIVWFHTTFRAFEFARAGLIQYHILMMKYSFAVTFAAVTFRLWVPFLAVLLDNQLIAYQLSAWLCWVINLAFVHYTKKPKPIPS